MSGRALSYFKRFRDAHSSNSWCVGHQRWDGVKFIPNRTIRVFGMGLFEKHPSGGPWKLGYKYKMHDENDNLVLDSETWEEDINPDPAEVEDHVIKHRFVNHPNGIEVRAGFKFDWSMWMSGDNVNRCYMSESGSNYAEIENTDMGLFTLKESSNTANATSVSRGIVPGILYRLA